MRHASLLVAAAIGAAAAPLAPRAAGADVLVTATGTVAFNGIATGPLAGVAAGSPVSMSFTVDPAVFVNSATTPTRGYPIDHPSFAMQIGPVAVGLQSPFPAGQTPYFVIRNNDPAVDGFFLSTGLTSPGGVPTNQSVSAGVLRANYLVTYGGATLSSLDIMGALGTYNFTGLTVFNWVMQVGPFELLGVDFTEMVISVEGCYPDCNADSALTVADFGCFQTKFVAGDPYADCNADGVLTVADFGCFQTKFVAGCP
jgi:hypothetical protein